jgi:hypothetical protein
VGTVAVLVAAAACDTGSETLFEDVGGAAGAAGSASNSGGKISASAGSATAGSGNGGTSSSTGGTPATGGGGGMGGTPTSGGTPANGGIDAGGTTTSGSGGSSSGGTGAGGDPIMAGAGEAGAPGGAEGGMAGDTSSAGAASGAGQPGSGGADGCGGNALGWKPRASNVMFLIDRSGTMFEGSKAWFPVRDAALPVIGSYDAALNIGFMAMTGEAASCPLLDEVAPGPGNYAAIASKYTSLAKPTKGESPFMLALSRARTLLDAAPAGEKFAILVVDGEPDFCSDGNDLCPIDAVVARIQALKAAGVTTLVAGLPIYAGANATLYAAALQSYANAGAGLPAASVGDTVANIYFQCNQGSPTAPSWKAEFDASGKPAQQALGTYSASPDSAPVTLLDPSDAASLTGSFTRLFGRTKSCRYQTTSGSVVMAQAASGVVKVNDTAIPYDATNGWQLTSETELELLGDACDAVRAAAAAQVSIDFPCSAVGN